MAPLARSLAVFVLSGIAVVMMIDLAFGAAEDRELPVMTTILLIGAVAVVQLLGGIVRYHPGAWDRTPPLWASRSEHSPEPVGVDAVRTWEALLVAATTGGDRARLRLANRIEQQLGVDIGPRLPMGDDVPADEVLDAVAATIDELEDRHVG